MQTKVSMVVPCYNKIEWVRPMFDSVLAQVWDSIELILVNDGSTDGTREVIAEYEPRFIKRGYDVVIVDQENLGVAAAVKHGLERVRGEYVCMPDCDDALHPEYVSAMAGVLDARTEFDCVTCDMQMIAFDLEGAAYLKRGASADGNAGEYPYRLFESILLYRASASVCTCLFKLDTLNKLSVVDNFITDTRATQEFQIWIPLALNNVRVLHCGRILYHYNNPDTRVGDRARYQSVQNYLLNTRNTFLLARLIVAAYRPNGSVEFSLINIIEQYVVYAATYRYKTEAVRGSALKMVQYINQTGLLDRHIGEDMVSRAGIGVVFRHFSNQVIGYPSDRIRIERMEGGRIIAYAAFGMAASQLKPGLLNADIRPDAFWDISAKPGDCVDGIPILIPDFDSLSISDTVLLLIKDSKIAQSIKDRLDASAAGANVWMFFDVLDHLTDYFFPHPCVPGAPNRGRLSMKQMDVTYVER